MKILFACLVGASLAHAIAEEDTIFETLTTLQGRTYQNAKVVQQDAARIRVMHDSGIASILITQLPEEFRERLSYDPAAADQLLTSEAKNRAVRHREARLFERWFIKERELAKELRTKRQQDEMTDFSQRFMMLRAWINVLESKDWADPRLQLVIDAAFERKAVVGMSQRLVEAAIGKPAEIESKLTETGIVDVWIYRLDAVRSQRCQFDDGMLVATKFEEKELPPPPVVVINEPPKQETTVIQNVDVKQPIVRVATPIVTTRSRPVVVPVPVPVQRQPVSRPIVIPARPVPCIVPRQHPSSNVIKPAGSIQLEPGMISPTRSVRGARLY